MYFPGKFRRLFLLAIISGTLIAPSQGHTPSSHHMLSVQVRAARQKAFKGASIISRDRDGETRLMLSVRVNDAARVRSLLAREAGINLRDHKGRTALMQLLEVEEPAPQAVRLLLDAGASVNAADKDGLTALMIGARSRDTGSSYSSRAEALLLTHGAHINTRDRDGRTALFHAIYGWFAGRDAGVYNPSEHTTAVLLHRHCDVNIPNDAGLTPLMLAVQTGDANVVEMLLRKGAAVNRRDRYGETALILAARSGLGIQTWYVEPEENLRIVRLLLAHGARTHFQDRHGYTALMWARKRNQGLTMSLTDAGKKVCELLERVSIVPPLSRQ